MGTQSQRLPPLDRLAVFDAAARHLPFTKAAAERFLTQSAVAVAEALSCLRTAVAVIRGPLARSRREVLTLTTTPFKGAWASVRSHALVTTTAAARRAAAQALCAWLLAQAREAS